MNNLDAIFHHYSSSSTSPLGATSSELSLNTLNHNYSHANPAYNNHYTTYKQSEDDHELKLTEENHNVGIDKDHVSPSNKGRKDKKADKKKMRIPKYAFQTRSQVDILDDGYRWRKYGQKAVKNNLFPRSYYRCTQVGCNVKKQVQRLSQDEGVVVTTYEGMHTHPVERSTDNFEHILTQMQIYSSY